MTKHLTATIETLGIDTNIISKLHQNNIRKIKVLWNLKRKT